MRQGRGLLPYRVEMGVEIILPGIKKGLKQKLESLLSVMVTPTGFEPVLPA